MHARNRGFTLVELLVVVALIGTISALAITYMGSAESESAETMNIANLKRLTSAAAMFSSMHKGKLPDKFDSLIRSDLAAVAPAADLSAIPIGFDTQDFIYVPANVKQVLYCGVDTDDDFVPDEGAFFQGLHEHNTTGFGNSLAVAKLTQTDVDNLKSAGIATVIDFNQDVDKFHGNYRTTARTLKADDYVAIVNPMASRNGKSVYQDCGFDLSDSAKYPVVGAGSSANDLTEAGVIAALQTKRLFVFGIGPDTTWIGDRSGGLMDIPECGIVSEGVYNRYFVVVAMPGGPNDTTPPYIAGILDSTGKTARGAASWATRTE